MIFLKSSAEIAKMREACKIAADARDYASTFIREGVTTRYIDEKIRSRILSFHAKPSFLGYNGFPASACISINNQVIHGIPSQRTLLHGDIVKIDVGAFYKGFHGDCAATFPVGEISEQAKKLIEVTRECFFKAEGVISALLDKGRLGDVSNAIFTHATAHGFGVVREFVGHGIGASLHEQPDVPNFGTPGRGARLRIGMTIAIEPMINAGGAEVKVLDDNWTVVTADGSLSAHYEHTIAITENGAEIMTL